MRLANYLVVLANDWCFQGNRNNIVRCQIKREVVCVSFVHDFHSKTLTVQNVSPRINDVTITANHRLVKIETVEVESHCGYTEGGKPNANHGPSSKKEMEATAVIKAGVLEYEPSEIAVCRDDVIRLFLLSKFIAIVL